MAVTVTMPQLGETVTEGTILSWAKQPGDSIAEDEVLLEISTDKVDTEVPSPAAGVLQEILVAEGETVSVGTPLAVIAEPGEAAGESAVAHEAAAEAPAGEAPAGEAPAGEAPAGEAPAGEAPAGEAPAGEAPAGEAPAETPAEQPAAPSAPEAEPQVVPEATAPAAAAPVLAPPPGSPVQAAAASAAPGPEASSFQAPAPSDEAPRRGILSPVVRKLAAEHAIDLDAVPGTGEGGRITRKDVMDFVAAAPAAAEPAAQAPATPAPAKVTLEPAPVVAPQPTPAIPAPAAPTAPSPTEPPGVAVPEAPVVSVPAASGDQVVDLSRLRTRIARNMINAKQTAAHVWASVEVDYERVERARQAHRDDFKEREGYSLTYLPFIARAVMDALHHYPVVNSSFYLEEGKQVLHQRVNLGISVDLDQEGLLVVTVKAADEKRLTGLARDIRTLANKARDGKLEPDDISGSTFTITNPGPYGSFMTAPIINVPNVAILSTDTVTKRPTVVTLPDGSDSIAIHHIGYLGLTWDHRAFDGSTAVLFLGRIKENLETWDWEQELS